MRNWIPFIGWRRISPQEALELGLDQPGRYAWELLSFEWLGCGFCVAARPRGVL